MAVRAPGGCGGKSKRPGLRIDPGGSMAFCTSHADMFPRQGKCRRFMRVPERLPRLRCVAGFAPPVFRRPELVEMHVFVAAGTFRLLFRGELPCTSGLDRLRRMAGRTGDSNMASTQSKSRLLVIRSCILRRQVPFHRMAGLTRPTVGTPDKLPAMTVLMAIGAGPELRYPEVRRRARTPLSPPRMTLLAGHFFVFSLENKLHRRMNKE
jgi:hypothetical protein